MKKYYKYILSLIILVLLVIFFLIRNNLSSVKIDDTKPIQLIIDGKENKELNKAEREELVKILNGKFQVSTDDLKDFPRAFFKTETCLIGIYDTNKIHVEKKERVTKFNLTSDKRSEIKKLIKKICDR